MGIKNIITVLTMLVFATTGCSTGCMATTYVERVRPQYTSSPTNTMHLMNSVVAMVQLNDENRLRTFCTAFFIGPRRLATAAHCVATHREVEIAPGLSIQQNADPVIGSEYKYVTYSSRLTSERTEEEPTAFVALVSAFNVDGDVALLDLAPTSPTSVDFLLLNSVSVAIGETTYAVGMPGGLPWILTQGIVSQLQRKPNGALSEINSSAQIYFGNSGGCLINDRGEVIGVASAIAYRQPHLGVFMPAGNLQTLVNQLLPISQRR